MRRVWMAAGALAGAGAVGMAAVTAHALAGRVDPAGLEAVRGAVQMQGWHALALLVTGLWLDRAAMRRARLLGELACAGFLLGMVLFCGGIYAHRLGGVMVGPVAPVGGGMLMGAWVLLAGAVV